MATKLEIRNYAQANGVSNAEARQHFINLAKKNQFNKMPSFIAGKPNKLATVGFGSIMFDVTTEFKKMHKMVTSDVMGFNTRSNKIDFDSANWGNDGGFFIAVLPKVKHGNTTGLACTNNNRFVTQKILSQFAITQLDDNWVMVSCFCTPDRAWIHYNELADNFSYAYIGYSTPKNLSSLAENSKLCEALSKNSKPNLDILGVMA